MLVFLSRRFLRSVDRRCLEASDYTVVVHGLPGDVTPQQVRLGLYCVYCLYYQHTSSPNFLSQQRALTRMVMCLNYFVSRRLCTIFLALGTSARPSLCAMSRGYSSPAGGETKHRYPAGALSA